MFEYAKTTFKVVDRQRSIVIGISSSFYDIADRGFFYCAGNGIEFEFAALDEEEVRAYNWKGKIVENNVPVVIHIFGPLIDEALRHIFGGKVVGKDIIEMIKKGILDGMFVLLTQSSIRLTTAPDYHVEYSADQ